METGKLFEAVQTTAALALWGCCRN